MSDARTDPRTAAARTSVAVVFGVNGFAMATWASRLPAIRDELNLSIGHLGLVLLAISVGSVSMLPLAGSIVGALGPARTVMVSAVVSMAGVTLIGLASTVWLLAVGLALTGSGIATWDVSMNVEGAEVERRAGRAIMPRFHAAFSLGTVFGAICGALAAAGSVPVRVHLPLVAGTVAVIALVGVRNFLPDSQAAARGEQRHEPGQSSQADQADQAGHSASTRITGEQLSAWLESKTLLIGVLVFSMALAEGSANDWLTLALVDGYGAVHALGAIGFGIFVSGMTAMRTAGPALLGRFDHVLVLRASAGLVLLGTALVISGALHADRNASVIDYGLGFLGALLWGMGAALGFPMGMTAAAADPARAAARVGVVSTIGYTAFLAGPPLLGALGQRIGTAQSLVGVSTAVLLALVTAGAVRQPRQVQS